MQRRLILVIALTLLATRAGVLRGQAAGIAGRLVDAGSGRAISAATVEIVGAARRSVTDETGAFRLREVPAGRWELRVTHLGYGTHADSLTLRPGRLLTIVIRLSPQAIALEPIDVAATARRQAGNTRIVTRQEIEAMEANARHLADVIRAHIPGATVAEGNRSGLPCVEFRGAPGGRTNGCNFPLVIVDEIPISDPAHFLRDTPLADVEQIQFVPASEGAARYGLNSVYGVLLVTMRRSAAATAARTRPVVRRSYPGYDWTDEAGDYPWSRTLLGSALGDGLGVVAGLAALGCFGDHMSGEEGCVAAHGFGTGIAALALPLVGSALAARLSGATRMSKGNVLITSVAASVPLLLGYAMYRDGRTSDLAGSQRIGAALVIVGTPVAATIADRLFRHRRGTDQARR